MEQIKTKRKKRKVEEKAVFLQKTKKIRKRKIEKIEKKWKT